MHQLFARTQPPLRHLPPPRQRLLHPQQRQRQVLEQQLRPQHRHQLLQMAIIYVHASHVVLQLKNIMSRMRKVTVVRVHVIVTPAG